MRRLAFVAAAMLMAAASADAANICNCCGNSTDAACSATCEAVKPANGLCLPVVDYAGKATISPGVNPLYGPSLRDLHVGTPDAVGREMLRRLLEAARRGAESDRRQAFRDFARGKIDRAASDAAEKRYGDAIVNYFLGMHAYFDTKTAN